MLIFLYTLVTIHLGCVLASLYMHRYVIHQQYQLNHQLETVMKFMHWILVGVVSNEFVIQHRKHHEFSDVNNDPHSPRFGFWKLLFICLIPSFFRSYKITISPTDYNRYGGPALPEPNGFIDKHPKLGVLLLLLLDVLLFGGLGVLAWVIHLFVVNLLSITTITVFGHSFGYRNFNSEDLTRNIIPIGILCVGEELHNNHHNDSRQANFAVNKNEFDLGFYYLQILSKLNLVEFKRIAKKDRSPIMWYEKLNFTVDVDRLRKEIEENVFKLGPQEVQGREFETPEYHGFGGYSLLTRTGDWHDGFEVFHSDDPETRELFFPNNQYNYKAMKYMNVSHPFEHDKPTAACTGYIREVLEELEQLGFYPRRARITCLKAHSKSLVHKDGGDNQYMARIHIPIITNPKCVHIAEGESLHMPADGSAYMLWVNNWHQIRNDSDEDRYHIIMDAYDTQRLTKNMPYEGDITWLKLEAEKYRAGIDAAVITDDELAKFEELKRKHIANVELIGA